jgi:hypothetical protein
MKPTERTSKKPSIVATGLIVALRGLPGSEGIGGPEMHVREVWGPTGAAESDNEQPGEGHAYQGVSGSASSRGSIAEGCGIVSSSSVGETEGSGTNETAQSKPGRCAAEDRPRRLWANGEDHRIRHPFRLLRRALNAGAVGGRVIITTPVNIRTDAAVWTDKEKKDKSTAPFVGLPINVATLGLLAVILSFFSLSVFAAVGPSPASANEPWWHVTSNVKPSVLQQGGNGVIVTEALNLGDASTSGPLTITDTLPEGVTVQKVSPRGTPEPQLSFITAVDRQWGALEEERFHGPGLGPGEGQGYLHACSEPAPRVVRCTLEEFTPGFPTAVVPYGLLELGIAVTVEVGAPLGRDESVVEVAGGKTPSVRANRPLLVGEPEATPAFGLEESSFVPESEGGGVDAQAGSHPFQLTQQFALNQNANVLSPPALAKDLRFQLPAGLVGNAEAIPQCSERDFTTLQGGFPNLCPESTAIGVATVTLNIPGIGGGEQTIPVPLFNLVPARGEPARFGFEVYGNPTFIDTGVRTGGDYGVTATVSNITQVVNFQSIAVTFWGVPDSSSHDPSRGWGCLAGGFFSAAYAIPCTLLNDSSPLPFLTLPTSCAAPWTSTVEGSSWPLRSEPGAQPASIPLPSDTYSLADAAGAPVKLTGCNALPFTPFVEVSPDLQQASSPSGLTVHVRVPQEVGDNAGGLASSNVKDITVALPAGVTLNPAGAGGLEACSEGLVGFEAQAGRAKDGFEEFNPVSEPGSRTPLFTSRLPGSFGSSETLQPGVNFCSDASKIATAKIRSPLLPNPIEGSVYLASQNANPFGSLVAMYIVAEDPIAGVLVKLPGEVSLCQSAGEVIAGMSCEAPDQIVTTFSNEPQLPFEDAELHFFGGERAPLSTPSRCGTYTTRASFAPWSGNEPVSSTSSFEIDSGPNGGPCPGNPLPFNPAVTGGALNLQAGAFSPLTVSMSRNDGEQNLKSIVAKLPPGLSGILTGVELCPEPNANNGTCGPNSLIGEATVSVGVGTQPFTVTGGRFYLTGPYNGTGPCTVGTPGCAPFGLTFEVPAKAGPFDLANTQHNHPACDCVLVRGKIEIDPLTTALTITSNPPGTPDSIPTSLEGIPLEIQHVNATTTRGNFQFNPTNCAKMALEGTVLLSEGGSDTITTPFQVTNCAALKFEPKFSVSTQAKTSKADGASLTAKVSYPNVPQGADADIAKVKVELPKQLPSRLTTLQKACTDAQFNANPAGCPAASKIGYATVHTPLIPVPLTGPAIFVSHGGEAFPSLEMVLQGYGITIDLVGTTFISKAGITSTTFKTVPDQPFSSFELTLPEGPYSALAANGNLCKETTTKTVKKKVTVEVKGHKKTETKKVKETVAASLSMPTEFVAQNGAEIHQTTPITVTGCGKAVKKSTKKHKQKQSSHNKGRA